MTNLTDQRPSAFAAVCAPVMAALAHAPAVGLAVVEAQQFQGWTLSGIGHAAAYRTTSKVDNYIGTSAKGAGTGTATMDRMVRINEARGLPPRGRPV